MRSSGRRWREGTSSSYTPPATGAPAPPTPNGDRASPLWPVQPIGARPARGILSDMLPATGVRTRSDAIVRSLTGQANYYACDYQ
jgi:hypothetical protein